MPNLKKYPFDRAAADEWARRFFPESQQDIATMIGCILVEQTSIPWQELSASTTFRELNIWDDFDPVNLVDAIEQQFGLSLTDGDLDRLNKVSDLVDCICDSIEPS